MIGIIDSGSGGANVILECMKYYNQDFVYLVDNKNCPYGNKKREELIKILNCNINFLINNYDLDFIILACNTLSSLADYKIMQSYKLPILKTMPNIKVAGKERILIFATKGTLKNCKEIKYAKNNYKIETLQIKGLPKVIDCFLSENSEENERKLLILLNKKFCKRKINKKLKFNYFNIKNKYKNITYISLGCTHFKHIEPFLINILGKRIKFYNCEEIVAKNSKWLIRKNKKNSTIKLILTQKDDKLESVIKNLFTSANFV